MRVTICAPSLDFNFLDLPASPGTGTREPSGGERSLYELATAAAQLGHDVELRGDINLAVLETITTAAGIGPRIDLASRPPEAGEVIVLPEGIQVPDRFCGVCLSGARAVLYLLGPPGLYGWSFRAGWTLPDPTAVAAHEVGGPETFQAIQGLGFSLWTKTDGIARAGERAGVKVTMLGQGTPVPFPDPVTKTHDVAIVTENRWSAAAEIVAAGLPGISVLRIPRRTSQYSLSRDLAPARLLIWPSRVEGASRIAREARGVGTVPVTLNLNPFLTDHDDGGGVVVATSLDDMIVQVKTLLHDPEHLDRLAGQAREGARLQNKWQPFVDRVGAALQSLGGAQPADEARSGFGAFIRGHDREQSSHYRAVILRLSDELTEVHRLARAQAELLEDRDRLLVEASQAVAVEKANVTAAQVALDKATAETVEVRRITAESAAAQGAEFQSERTALTRALGQAQSELDAYRSRRVIRLVDGTAPGRLVGRLLKRRGPGEHPPAP